jgi:hypothetical protein
MSKISLKTWDKLVEHVRQATVNLQEEDWPDDTALVESVDALCAYVLSHRAAIREALILWLAFRHTDRVLDNAKELYDREKR